MALLFLIFPRSISSRLLLQHGTAFEIPQPASAAGKKSTRAWLWRRVDLHRSGQKGAHVDRLDINPWPSIFTYKQRCQRRAPEHPAIRIFLGDTGTTLRHHRHQPALLQKQAVTAKDHAWFCGEHGEYFSVLFDKLARYMHEESEVLMVLFDGCDMNMIRDFAKQNNFSLNCIQRKRNLLETNFIYKIETTYALRLH